MRIERWYWLGYFCAISFVIHIGLVLKSRAFTINVPQGERAQEIEVALSPLEAEKPKPKPIVKPIIPDRPRPKVKEKQQDPPELKPRARRAAYRVPRARSQTPIRIARATERSTRATPVENPTPNQVAHPGAAPGAAEALSNEKPVPDAIPGLLKGPVSPKFGRTQRSALAAREGGSEAPAEVLGGHGGAPGPEAPPEDILYAGSGAGGTDLPKLAPRIGGGGGNSILSVENPLSKEFVHDEAPGIGPGRGGGLGAGSGGGVGFGKGRGIGTHLNGKVDVGTLLSKPGRGIGAGSGTGIGTRAPGGGHGTGSELPGTGGSGTGYGRGTGNGIRGHSRVARIMDVENPLGKLTSDDSPGLGNGAGKGGQGGRDKFPGMGGRPGHGFGKGNPGTGSGTGVGLGTRGSGRGKGGIDSPGAPGGIRSAGSPTRREGTRVAFADNQPSTTAGDLLRPPPPRGTIFGARVNPGAYWDIFHVVYVLDVSDSMNEHGKMPRAKQALKNALKELESKDTFNIVMFDTEIRPFASSLVKPSSNNIQSATNFIENQGTNFGTNLSGALGRALSMEGVTHIYLITDGDPTEGIKNIKKLRQFAVENNVYKAQIVAIALGVGTGHKGSELLKGLAEDSGGSLTYVKMKK